MKITDAVINIVYRVTLVYFYWLMATTVISQAALAQVTDISINKRANLLLFPTKPDSVKILETEAITLTQAIDIALRNNLDLQIAMLELKRSRSALRQVQADLFPNLNVNSNITRSQSASNQLAIQPFQGRLGDNPTNSFSADLQFIYKLYTSGNRNATIQGAEEQLRENELDVEIQSETVRLNVTLEYHNLQAADEQVRINQSAVVNASASLRDAQAQEKAGVGTKFDVLRSQVNLANAQQALTNSLSEQQIAQRRLTSLINVPQSLNITAKDPVKLAGLWNKSLEDTVIQAFQNRPELPKFLAQRNISIQRRRQALSQLGPQISLVASYSLLDQFNDNTSVTDGYSLGVQASLNLFDGGATKARAAQEKANITIAEVNFAKQRDQIRFDVEQQYNLLQSNLTNIQTTNLALEQAKEALRLARLRFQAGVGTQTDVIAAENDLTRADS
ncbi:MAG: TolC family protein, partial [Calothrix sp. SM1_7_51]|nr:TolC family protein [Calothrix sp. SM1_7_51]